MRISFRFHHIFILMNSYIERSRRRSSPIVSQPELVLLLKKDRSDVISRLRVEDDLRRRPRRGIYPVPRKTLIEWRDFVAFTDEGIAYLGDQRSTPELEDFVRAWQMRRKTIETTIWHWNRRRADIIPMYHDPEQRTSADGSSNPEFRG